MIPYDNQYLKITKRLIDLIIAIPLLAIVAPFFAVIALAIRFESPGPVFFRQLRLGYHEKTFQVFKFRTMLDRPPEPSRELILLKDDPRITRIGAILRKYRIDELPQLINVLLGNMSLVGPRPLLPEYLASYSPRDRGRMNMPAGMTGWQQVNGASTNTWEERISLDLWYIEHWRILLDFRILYMTIATVIKADTVYDKDSYGKSGIPTRLVGYEGNSKLNTAERKDRS